MSSTFLKGEEVSTLYEEYMESLPTRRNPHGSNYILSATERTTYKQNEAIELVTINTGLEKEEVILRLIQDGHSEVMEMDTYSYTYYKVISEVRDDG